MNREMKARINNIKNTLRECADELENIWDEETKELEQLNKELWDTGPKIIMPKYEEQYPRIADLKAGEEGIVLKAQVVAIQSKKGEKDGKEWALLTLTLSDGTSNINLPLFNEQMEKADGLKLDDWAIIKVWKAELYKERLQLVAGKGLSITKLSG